MLRVSTANFYRSGESNIVERQAELLKVQAQLASGKRINSPGDDPLGAADVNSIRSGCRSLRSSRTTRAMRAIC